MKKDNPRNNWLYIHNGNFDLFEANKIQVCQMCKAFLKAGEKISLLGLGENDKKILKMYNLSPEIKTFFLSPGKNPTSRSLRLFFYFLKIKNDFNSIYTRDPLVAFLIKRLFPRKCVILELHTIPPKLSRRCLLKMAYSIINCLVVISQGIKNDLTKLGIKHDKIIILPDAVDLEAFYENKLENITVLPDNKIIMYAGSLKKWKGYITFLKSSIILNDRKDLTFVILGGEKEEVAKLKNKYPDVIFLGAVPNNQVPAFLKKSYVLVIPNSKKFEISKNHTSPLKLFEYMASGKPIIASNLPSIREIVTDNEVLFFSPDDPQNLSANIEELTNNDNLREKLAFNAFEKVKKFTWEARVNKIIRLANN